MNPNSDVQAQVSPHQPVGKKRVWPVVAIFVVIILLVAGGFFFELRKTNNELATTKTQNSNLENQVQTLNSQLVASHDMQRKRDVALLADVIKDYNKTATLGHLTTEGDISRGIYEGQLSKAIPDFKDPKTQDPYTYEAVAPVQTPSKLTIGLIQYQWPAKCNADNDFVDTTDQSTSALRTLLENGSAYCMTF